MRDGNIVMLSLRTLLFKIGRECRTQTREVYQAAESVDWRDRFDALQDVYKFVKKGDAFPAFDLSIDEVEFLLRQGWVREGPNGIEFVCMPEPNVDLKSRVYREKEAKHDAIRRSVL